MVSVNHAIRKGQNVLYISLAVWVLCFFTAFGYVVYATQIENPIVHPGLLAIILFPLSFVILFIVWGILIVHWKIWSYTYVHNIHKFQRDAENYNLLYSNKKIQNWFEIKTSRQKAKLKKLEERFLDPEPQGELLTHSVLPEQINVGMLWSSLIILSLSALCSLGVGVFFIIMTINIFYTLFGVLMILFGLWLFKTQILSKRIKFILSKEGIIFDKDEFVEWSKITRVEGYLLHINIEYTNQYGTAVTKSYNLKDMNKNFLQLDDYIKYYRHQYKSENEN